MGTPKMISHLKLLTPSSLQRSLPGWWMIFVVVLPRLCAAAGTELPPALRVYQVGDIAPADLVTPYLLAVPDPVETARLRAIEGVRSPSVFRHNTTENEIAVQELTNNWFSTRQRFVEILKKSYSNYPLSKTETTAPTFLRFTEVFRVEYPTDVFSLPLAQTWAVGGADQEAVEGFSTLLREVMRRRILSDSPVPPELPGDARVRLISTPPTPGTNLSGLNLYRTNFVSLEQTRSIVRAQLAGDSWSGDEFLPAFIRANCWFDQALTAQLRTQNVAAIIANTWISPGEIVVAKGSVIDDQAKAALDQLRLRVNRASSPASRQRPVAPPVPWWKTNLQDPLFWIVAGILVLIAAGTLVWRAFRSPRVDLVPGTVRDSKLLRLASTRRTGHDSLMEKVLTSEIIQRLFGQRQTMIETQLSVTSGAMALESRLGRVERQMHSRFHAYERRIVELEKELAESEELSRELIRAKIRNVKLELQAAQAQDQDSKDQTGPRLNLN
ncbi:MAG: hypothetical protein H7X97_11835 [Opitutaceae bacterium]|nr:hypothetical protein [Verrucomicrobiales bacterium]